MLPSRSPKKFAPSQETVIHFRGVELVLPADLPFSQAKNGSLTLDCSHGFFGKLQLKPTLVPKQATQEKLSPSKGVPTSIGDPQDNLRQPVSSAAGGQIISLRQLDQVVNPVEDKLVIPDSQVAPSLAGLSWFNKSPCKTQSPHAAHKETGAQATPGNLHRGCGNVQPASACQQPSSSTGPAQNASAGPESGTDMPAAEADVASVEPAGCHSDDASVRTQAAPRTPHCGNNAQDPIVAAGSAGLKQVNGQPTQVAEEIDGGTPASTTERPPAKTKSKRRSEVTIGNSTGRRSGKKSRGSSPLAAGMSFMWRALVGSDTSGGSASPSERWGASLTVLENQKVCLFAGSCDTAQLGDTWILDVEACAWQRSEVAQAAVKAWHSVVTVPSEEGAHLFAIGGERSPAATGTDEDEPGAESLSEVCQLDTEAGMWVTLPMQGKAVKRSGHTTTLLPNGRLLLFGGVDDEGRYCNDAHIIDTHQLTCFSLAKMVKGAPPKPRAYHTATLVGDSIVILGGIGVRPWSLREVYSLSTQTWQWKEHTPVVEGDAPVPRSGHSAVALPGGRHVLVFGGGVPDTNAFFGTVAVLDTRTWTWSLPTLQGPERPRARSGHSTALVALPDGRHGLVVYGGRTTDDVLCSDTWMLEVQ